MTYTATLGSISHGTLQTGDLMIAFADELNRLSPGHDLVKEAEAVQTLWAAGWNDLYDREEAMELVDQLSDTLNDFAPPYCYFGAHDGDGSDFGFWPSIRYRASRL